MSLSVSVPLDWDAVAWHTVSVGPSAGAAQPAGAREESGTFCFEERAIVWRVIGSVVYLVEHSLDAHLQQSGVRLVFSSFVCPGPCFFFSVPKQHLRMLVLTADGSLHRFTFEGQFADSVFVAVCNFADLMGSASDAAVPLPSSMHEQFDRVLVNARPLRIVSGFQDASIVASTRSGALVVCSLLAGGAVAEQQLAQADAAGLVTLQQPREEAFTFVLERNGLFSGFALSSRQQFVTLQLSDRGADVRGVALRMFVRDARRVHFLALVQTAASGVQFQTVRADFPGNSIELELVACETIPAASSTASAAIVDFTEGPVGVVCLHADGSVSCKVGNVWQVARPASLGHLVPHSPASELEWTHFCQSLKSDPYVSRFLLRAVQHELVTRGFIGEEDDLASAVFNCPAHERESVLRVFLECHKQSRLGSSVGRLGHAGLPVLVGPGGLSVLFPLPPLSQWPEGAPADKRRLLDLCRLTDAALSPEQWLQFDAEAFGVGPEEACLGAMRHAVATSLPLELPLLWSRLQDESGDALAAAAQLIAELCDSALPADVWSSPLSPLSSAPVSFSGPVPTHAAACAVRSGAEGHYLLLRSLLVTMHALLASSHRAVTAVHRGELRARLIPKSVGALRLFASLRAALRAPHSEKSLVGVYALPFASAARALAATLSSLCTRFNSQPSQQGVASFSLYALFVALRAPVLLMRALAACREFEALARLAGPTESADAPAQFFSGVAQLHHCESEAAFAAFRGAAIAARNQGTMEALARVSGDLPVGNSGDAYLLNVIAQFEKCNASEMVVKVAEFALATAEDSNQHIFLNKSFRHNLKLKRFGEAYLNILASPSGDMAARKLRRFVVEVCVTAAPAALCEFPFVGHHIAAVADVLTELAAVSDWKDVSYGQVLYAFHTFRGNFREAAAAAYALAGQMRADSNVPPNATERTLMLAVAALRLSPKQWIVVPKDTPVAAESSAKRRADSERKQTVGERAQQQQQRVVTLLQMQQELALASARAVLPRLHLLVSPSDALALLVAAGRIARALALARVFELDASAAFEKMTHNALRNAPLLGDASDEMADLVSNGKSAWTNLEQLMQEHDSRKTNYSYGKTIARTLLCEGGDKLPAWLAQFLTANHPEALLQIYLSFSMLSEAHHVALFILAQPNHLIPFNLLDKMMATKLYDSEKQLQIRKAINAAAAARK